MPKGPDGQKRPADLIGCAVRVAQIATGESEDEGYISQGRRKSGLAGAQARLDRTTKKERTEIARKAASARWNKEKENDREGKTAQKAF